MSIIFGFLPVVLFLGCLFLLDSFKLVKIHLLILSLSWGIVGAAVSFLINNYISTFYNINFDSFSKYIAPLSEELVKIAFIIILVSTKRVGFIIDASIYGFATGAGFALAENLFYLLQLGNSFSIVLSVVRGFGTALMHGGAAAVFAMIMIEGVLRSRKIIYGLLPGIIVAYILHSIFNHFILSPLLQALLMAILLPLVFYLVFSFNTKNLQEWLELEFSSEVEMLRMIRSGQFSATRAGNYLASLKKHFAPDILLDMYCFISLYIELSIKVKRNIMLRESGFVIIPEPGLNEKLTELKHLRKHIGKAGELALRPLIRLNYRELWKLNQLKK